VKISEISVFFSSIGQTMKKEHFILAFVAIFLQINIVAASRWLQSLPDFGMKDSEIRIPHSEIHSVWDKLLQKYVVDGRVNYKGFKTDKIALTNYIQTLSTHVPAARASKQEQMAFWLNAYNALTIKLIVAHYPVKSIKDLDKGNPWDASRYPFGDKNYTLNEIENTILRPMGDARIHFGLNCAAKSCPPLQNRAFIAATVETQLDQLTRAFVTKTVDNPLKSNTIKISNIFNWYAADFGSVIVFLNKYITTPISKNAKITYTTYDWSLNE
jgi:hypothetical protein